VLINQHNSGRLPVLFTKSLLLPRIMRASPNILWIAAARPRIWSCNRATAGNWFRGVPERYVAGADTRGRQKGRPYPWSQQV